MGSAILLFAAGTLCMAVESYRGVRLFEARRSAFDAFVGRLEFIAAHVDLVAFARDESLHIGRTVAHDIAHGSLQSVRATERFLTRVVRHLRSQRSLPAEPRESSREFVKTLSDFKGHLTAHRPEMPDVRELVP
jgi:hypothetical protein